MNEDRKRDWEKSCETTIDGEYTKKGEVRESADLKFRVQAIAPELDRDKKLRLRMEQIVGCCG